MIKHSHELCWTQKLPSSLQIYYLQCDQILRNFVTLSHR